MFLSKWMEILNKVFFQFLFIRLTKCIETTDIKINEVSILKDGAGVGGTVKSINEWYSIQGFILPLTGWKSDFIFLNKKPFNIQITKKIKRSCL